jgi:glucose-1-phosphate adenylyltransferase
MLELVMTLSVVAILQDTLMMGADRYETKEEALTLLLSGKVSIGIGENTKIR